MSVRSAKSADPRLYLIGGFSSRLVKVGISNDVRRRVNDLQTGSPDPLSLIWVGHENDSLLERDIHEAARAGHSHGEWFTATSVAEALSAHGLPAAVASLESWLAGRSHEYVTPQVRRSRACRQILEAWMAPDRLESA